MNAAPWWRDAVIYQVYIRSFADSDGDGVGDMPGIRSRLGYLSELGVDALWITPFYPSPMADGGYDVADYRDVEPMFGTLADFDAMIADAHAPGPAGHRRHRPQPLQRPARVVPGGARRAAREPRARAVRLPQRQGRRRQPSRRPTGCPQFGGRAWTRVPDGEWYLHLFTPEQPDLNWELPEVREEFHSILRFWLDRGVDGFRIDVAHGLAKDQAYPLRDLEPDDGPATSTPRGGDDNPLWDRDDVHDIYRGWHEVLASYPGDRMSVAEAWVASPERRARYVRPDELSQAFNFDFLRAEWGYAAAAQVRWSPSCRPSALVGAAPTWVLANHDVDP